MSLITLLWHSYRLARKALKTSRLTEIRLGNTTLGQRLGRVSRWAITKYSGLSADTEVLVHGHRMFLTGWEDGVTPFVDLVVNDYEPETTRVVERLLKPGMVTIDIGAHVGYYTLLAARCVGPEGRVYAFEPEPRGHAGFAKNIEMNGYKNAVAAELAPVVSC